MLNLLEAQALLFALGAVNRDFFVERAREDYDDETVSQLLAALDTAREKLQARVED